MTLPFFCVIFAMLMLIITKAPVAAAMFKLGGYDNRHPREQQSRLEGWGKRALAAHKNESEAFPLFAASVFIAHLSQGDPAWSTTLAMSYIIARLLYMVFYIIDWNIFRSIVWAIGYGSTLGLALLAVF